MKNTTLLVALCLLLASCKSTPQQPSDTADTASSEVEADTEPASVPQSQRATPVPRAEDDYEDHEPDTFWSQMTLTGIRGERRGEELSLLPVTETTWAQWKTRLHLRLSGQGASFWADRRE